MINQLPFLLLESTGQVIWGIITITGITLFFAAISFANEAYKEKLDNRWYNKKRRSRSRNLQ